MNDSLISHTINSLWINMLDGNKHPLNILFAVYYKLDIESREKIR